jgi:hypothetical protein
MTDDEALADMDGVYNNYYARPIKSINYPPWWSEYFVYKTLDYDRNLLKKMSFVNKLKQK